MGQTVLAKNIKPFFNTCGHNFENEGGGSLSCKDMNSGTLNFVDLSFEFEDGESQTVEKCTTRLNALRENCGESPKYGPFRKILLS